MDMEQPWSGKPADDTVCVESIRSIMRIFGSKWSFMVMGELHSGPRRFNELNRALGCSTKSLSDTLKSLEVNGVVSRTVTPSVPVAVTYALTEKGRDFEQVFWAMREWGAKLANNMRPCPPSRAPLYGGTAAPVRRAVRGRRGAG